MSKKYLENIGELLSNDNFAFVIQGLNLLETCLSNDENQLFWNAICDVKAVFQSLVSDDSDEYPQWLPKGPHRRYAILWILGFRAKCGDSQVARVKEISLNNPAFTSLPPILKYHTALETFQLNRSNWTSIDDIWDSFPNLKVLDLFDNELTSLPDSVGRCSNLHTLTLSSNPFSQLPECIRSLTHLKKLNLRYCKFSTLPDWLGELEALQSLNLESSEIIEIPESVGHLKNLQTLELNHACKLQRLPDAIGECTALQSMCLPYHHELEYLPSTLRVLECGDQVLLSFWDVLLKMSNLEKAMISKETNKDPDQLSFENGEEIDFGWWPKLKHLELNGGNFNLETLRSCSQLEYLEVSRDQKELSESIGSCTNLKSLILRWSEISVLPESISNLDKLEKLALSDCFDWAVELEKLTDILYKKTVGTEVVWQLQIEGLETSSLDAKREHLIAKEFASLNNRELLEKVTFRLDADTPLPDISECPYLDSITIQSNGEIPLSHLTNLKVGPCLKNVNIQASLPSFPTEQIRDLLGTCEYVSQERGSGRRHRLQFERNVSMSNEWKTDLENLRLQIADELDVLKELPEFSWYGVKLPEFVGRMTGLRSLSCSYVKSRDIPKAVLNLPNLETIESADSDFPEGWPIWTVAPSEVKDFQYLDALYQNTRVLIMKGCMLREIPKCVLGYQKLRRINLAFNCLQSLPDAYPNWQNVEEINLMGNPLQSIPSALLSLPNLKQLKLPKQIDMVDLQKRFTHIDFHNCNFIDSE